MYNYTLYGLTIETDLDFPQLISITGNQSTADITIISGDIPHFIYEKEQSNIYYGFSEDFCWLSNKQMYIAVYEGNKIIYKLKENAKDHRNYLLGWGMSMICYERKTPAIHCSTITDGQYAYLIAGESGSGKSTVTDALIEKGYRFMADDVIRVEQDAQGAPIAYPCFPFRKLCRDAALRSGYDLADLIYIDEDKDKFLVPSHELFHSEPLPVKALIIIAKNSSDELNFGQLTGINAFLAVVRNTFLRHLLGDKKYEPFSAQPCLKIASKINCYYISRPDGKDTINEMMNKISEIIA